MALLQLGQAAPAQRAFEAAAQADPALDAEAASGQAARALCAARRRPPRRCTSVPLAAPPSNTPAALDESHGRATALRPFELPGTPDNRVVAPAEKRRADVLMRRIVTAYKRPEITAVIDAQIAESSDRQFRILPGVLGQRSIRRRA